MDSLVVHLVGENKEAGTVIDEYVGPASLVGCQEWLRRNGFSEVGNVGTHWKNQDDSSFVQHFHEDERPLSRSPRVTTLYAHIKRVRSLESVQICDRRYR